MRRLASLARLRDVSGDKSVASQQGTFARHADCLVDRLSHAMAELDSPEFGTGRW